MRVLPLQGRGDADRPAAAGGWAMATVATSVAPDSKHNTRFMR